MVATFRARITPSLAEIGRVHKDMAKELRDWRPAWRALLPALSGSLAELVEQEHGPLGETWPELAPDTLRRRERQGRGRSMLQHTGRLLAQLRSPVKSKRSLTKKRLAVGPKDRHPYMLHFGTGRIPARPFIGWTPELQRRALEIMNLHAAALVALASQRIAALPAER